MNPLLRPVTPLLLLCFLTLAGCMSNPYRAPPDVATPPTQATVLPSGLAYRVLRSGNGNIHPTLSDTVVVNYIGWTTDGHMFDSSYSNGEPVTFPLNRLIKGWQQMLPLMTAGEKVRCWIPPELAYGVHPTKPGAPSGTLVFDIELIRFNP